jgi:hypothetical protein
MTLVAPPFPNVHARLRRVHTAPGIQPATAVLSIWLRQGAFRIHDETGRWYSEIMDDVRSERGFGATPRTIEDFMDAAARARHVADRDATEIYGDLETGEGTVREAGRSPWPVDPTVIVPVAAQLFADGRELDIEPTSITTYLGRPCTEYRFTLTGREDTTHYRSAVRWLVSGPFVLYREVRDEHIHELSTVTEVIELNEGAVTDSDLRI